MGRGERCQKGKDRSSERSPLSLQKGIFIFTSVEEQGQKGFLGEGVAAATVLNCLISSAVSNASERTASSF